MTCEHRHLERTADFTLPPLTPIGRHVDREGFGANRDQAGSPDAYALLVQAGFREQQPNATLQVHGLLKCLTDLRVDYFTLRQSVDQFERNRGILFLVSVRSR